VDKHYTQPLSDGILERSVYISKATQLVSIPRSLQIWFWIGE